MSKLKIVSQEATFTGKLFSLNKLHVEVQGTPDIWYHFDIRSTVFVFPLTENNEIYLLRQYREMIKKERIQVVAGFVEDNEAAESAAKRELEEEAGLISSTVTEFGNFDGQSTVMNDPFHFFVARGLTQEVQRLEGDEEISVFKVPFTEAIEMVVKGEITSYKTVTGLLLLDKLMSEGKI